MNRCTSLLICPICGERLADVGQSLRCPRRHTFDRAREGYVHMLPEGHGRSTIPGDTRDMVRARRRVLDSGLFEPLSDAIALHADHHLATTAGPAVIVDAGCGVGYHIARLRLRTDATGCFFGIDISKEALRLAARAHPDITFLLNDIGHRLCVADGAAHILLDIFAPRNPDEFARVLRPAGLLVIVIPAEKHLIELRSALPMLDIEPEKRERILEQMAGAFERPAEDVIEYRLRPDASMLRDLIAMGPSARHMTDGELLKAVDLAGTTVTLHLRVLRFQRADRAVS